MNVFNDLKKSTAAKLTGLILLTFALKLAAAFYFSNLHQCQFPETSAGRLALLSGDTHSYIGAIDNLKEEGVYYFWNGVRRVYAGRMPYYGAPYYLLRFFLDKPAAADILVLFQILTDAAANVFFAFLCFRIFKSRAAFWIGFALCLLSFNYFLFSLQLVPESLSLNFFIFFLYAFQRYRDEGKWIYAVYASFLLALVVVLKPYLALIYIPFFGAVLWKRIFLNNFDLKAVFSKLFVLSLPLSLLLAPWIIRNAFVLGRFIPAQENITAGYNYTEADFAFRRFVGAWGGSMIFWDPKSAGCYFTAGHEFSCTFELPAHALTEGYGLEEIEEVRRKYIRLQEQFSPDLEREVVEKFDRLTEIYRNEKPFMYYVGSRFLTASEMFLHTNVYNLPVNPSFRCFEPYQLVFKGIQFLVYCLALTLGSAGLLILSRKRKISLFYASAILPIVFFFAYFKLTEARYMNQTYPILLIGLTYAVVSFNNLSDSIIGKAVNISENENTI